jgi:aspartyl protease family protein
LLGDNSSMPESANNTPGKQLGQGMLAICFVIGLGALTLFFDGQLGQQVNPNQAPLLGIDEQGHKTVRLKQNRQGHYLANGYINGIEVTFLLDTGATDVAIPQAVAQTAGLIPGLSGVAATANGRVTVYTTAIDQLELGNIVLNNVSGSITPSMPGNTILLGMSALRQVEFTQRGDVLTLKQLSSN